MATSLPSNFNLHSFPSSTVVKQRTLTRVYCASFPQIQEQGFERSKKKRERERGRRRKVPSVSLNGRFQDSRQKIGSSYYHKLPKDTGIMCEPCNGKGWLLCDFCNGQKTNVKAENKRIYRRCPSCRAIGYVLCSKCRAFKCVTFPDYNDGEL